MKKVFIIVASLIFVMIVASIVVFALQNDASPSVDDVETKYDAYQSGETSRENTFQPTVVFQVEDAEDRPIFFHNPEDPAVVTYEMIEQLQIGMPAKEAFSILGSNYIPTSAVQMPIRFYWKTEDGSKLAVYFGVDGIGDFDEIPWKLIEDEKTASEIGISGAVSISDPLQEGKYFSILEIVIEDR